MEILEATETWRYRTMLRISSLEYLSHEEENWNKWGAYTHNQKMTIEFLVMHHEDRMLRKFNTQDFLNARKIDGNTLQPI